MEFVIGFLGALVAGVLFFGGAVIGWKANSHYSRKVTAEQLSEKQQQKLREEREAWNTLFDYSAEVAYGGETSARKHIRSDAG